MKTLKFCFVFAMLWCMVGLSGQVPVGFNYQAVARNANGVALTGTSIEVVLQVRAGSENGTLVWEEVHNLTTNAVGAFSVVLGGDPGSRTDGSLDDFSDIDWSANTYYLKVEVDGNDMGSKPFQAVPYAALAMDVVNGGENTWSAVDGNVFLNDGNVAIGTDQANSKVTIQGDPGSHIDTALFEVKNVDGIPVFAVYNEGVRIYVEDNNQKGVKGGFAVGGYNTASKGLTNEYLRVTPDSVRIWVKDRNPEKGVKGGFAVGGYNTANKNGVSSFVQLYPRNYFIGHEAGINNDKGRFNSFFGYNAGHENTNGSQNIFIGYQSGYSNTNGVLNTFIGNNTGYHNSTGFANVFIGDSSGYYNDVGQWNVFVGEGTGIQNTNGWSNVFIGDKAGRDNTEGSRNVFLGSIAGWKNKTGFNNVFIGTAAGRNNIDGSDNTFMGSNAGRKTTSGGSNIFIGKAAGHSNVTGSDNIYIGAGAGWRNDSTHSNIYIGNNSGDWNTAGYGNAYLGNRTGHNIVDGNNNTILGHEAAHWKSTGDGNVYLGAYAGHQSGGGWNNVMLGASAGHWHAEGHSNTYVGESAGYFAKGNENVFIGRGAGFSESGSGKLYIENSGADSANALIYGDFYNDLLTINGRLGINTVNPLVPFHVSGRPGFGWTKMMVGMRDSIAGFIELGGTGDGQAGGSVRLGVSSEWDDVNDWWQVSIWENKFQIGNSNDFNVFVIKEDGQIEHRGVLLHADYVFEEDYELESIEEHAEFMWTNKHLPAVPKKRVDEDGMEVMTLGARSKGVLEELEKAHIYIEQLNEAIKVQGEMIEELKAELESMKCDE